MKNLHQRTDYNPRDESIIIIKHFGVDIFCVRVTLPSHIIEGEEETWLQSELSERGGCYGDYFYSLSLPQCVYCALYSLYCHHLYRVMVITEGVWGNLQLVQTMRLMWADSLLMNVVAMGSVFVCCISVTVWHLIAPVTPLLPPVKGGDWCQLERASCPVITYQTPPGESGPHVINALCARRDAGRAPGPGL